VIVLGRCRSLCHLGIATRCGKSFAHRVIHRIEFKQRGEVAVVVIYFWISPSSSVVVVVIVAVAEGPVTTSGAVVTTAGVITSVVYRGLAVGDRRMVGADNRRIMRAHKKAPSTIRIFCRRALSPAQALWDKCVQ